MDLSIVIVSFNTKKLLNDCLSSLGKILWGSRISYEIIVVDNVSTDGTREMLMRKYPKVVTILNKDNVGFGRANNQGIQKATGEYVLLLNSDTVVLTNSIESLYAFAREHPKTFVGPKLLNADMSPQTSCGPFFSLPVVFAALFLKGDVLGITRWSPNGMRAVDWVSGACFIGRRTAFLDDLLFDEKIFMYMEEVDLFMRAKKRGYQILFYPESRIVHLGSGSSTNKRTGPVLNIYKGFLYIYRKHYSKAAYQILRLALIKKAVLSLIIGYLTGNEYLKKTYAEALRLV
jgi:GT2 family glycosyltransferase